MQIQDSFQNHSLADLAQAGLGIYDLIPTYRQSCPSCGRADCTVRHGLYFRQVIDRGAIYERFPVPRFRCRNPRTDQRRAVTFSVLPDQLLPRKRPSVRLASWMLDRWLVAQLSVAAMLDELAESFHSHRQAWLPEVSTVYRLLHLFALAQDRLEDMHHSSPEPRVRGLITRHVPDEKNAKNPVPALLQRLVDGRGPPPMIHYHRIHFPRLLFGARPSPRSF